MNLDNYKNKIRKRAKLEKPYGGEFYEKWRMLIFAYPETQLEKGKWMAQLSRTTLNDLELRKVLDKSFDLPKGYNKLGFVFNQIIKNKKPPKPKKFVHTLFGVKEVK